MGVYIPNMEKPKSCDECQILRAEFDGSYDKPITGCRQKMGKKNTLQEEYDALLPDCPLIEIDLEKDIPTIWYNRQTRRYEPKGTKQEVYERLYKLKNGERRSDET